MNKIQGALVSAVLIAIFMGTVSVEAALPPSPPTLNPQTTSVDINVIDVVPGLTFQPGTGEVVTTGIGITTGFSGGPVDATAGFSFAPHTGFSSVNQILATIVFFGGVTGGYNAFGAQLNGQSPVNLPVTTVQNTVVGTLRNKDLLTGANAISLSLVLAPGSTQAITYIFQVRLTVEYTYIA